MRYSRDIRVSMCPRRCALSELTRGKMENGVRRCRGHTRQATRDLARSAGCRLAYLTKAGEAGLSNQALCAMRILYWVINININIFAPHYVVLAVA